MDKENKIEEFFSWYVFDNEPRERTGLWYLISGIIALLLIIYSIYTVNFLFAIMIILIAFIVIINDSTPSKKIKFAITDQGIQIDKKIYNYNQFKSFYIVYDPPIKKLFFEFNTWKYDLSIQLYDNDPLAIREFLLELIPENYEKEEEPMSELVDNFFKF